MKKLGTMYRCCAPRRFGPLSTTQPCGGLVWESEREDHASSCHGLSQPSDGMYWPVEDLDGNQNTRIGSPLCDCGEQKPRMDASCERCKIIEGRMTQLIGPVTRPTVVDDERAEYMRKYKEEKRKAGICPSCGCRKGINGNVTCEVCLARTNKARKKAS